MVLRHNAGIAFICRGHMSAPAAELHRIADLSKTRPVWLRVGQLIDGTSDVPLKDANVVFNAREILAITEGEERPTRDLVREGLTAPDAILPEVTLMPMLIEAHAHLFLDGAPVNFVEREEYL